MDSVFLSAGLVMNTRTVVMETMRMLNFVVRKRNVMGSLVVTIPAFLTGRFIGGTNIRSLDFCPAWKK